MASSLLLAGCAKEFMTPKPSGDIIEGANGLVITAVCGDQTKTDINNGKSTWEAGDKITVVYDGKAYSYVTSQAGATAAFASTDGIKDYDASKPLLAYYPETGLEGVVTVEAERSVTFVGENQANAAKAPLVGVTASNVPQDGSLPVTFSNVCSVMELRIDAGTLSSPAKSLTLEPAEGSEFSGYISFKGTVDPATLAITTSESAQSIKLVLPEGTDLTKAQTIKFPVGRFTSSKGLKATLETADGKTYEKNIYKSGIVTYTENGGRFGLKHLVKAMYAYTETFGAIRCAQDLLDFAAAWNAGESIADYVDESGTVVVEDDLDMTGVETWTPIGVSAFNRETTGATLSSGKPFTGKFDGKGHTVKNLNMVCTNDVEGAAWGLFGGLKGATVENIIFDNSCSLTISPSKPCDAGVLAGAVVDSKVSGITNNAPITYVNSTIADNVLQTGGVIGGAYAMEKDAEIVNVVNNADVNVNRGNCTKNGWSSVQVGTIAGFACTKATPSYFVKVTSCENHGNVTTNAGRASAFITACNRGTILTDCTNYGNLFDDFGGSAATTRTGVISAICADHCSFIRVKNYGNGTVTDSGCIGGLIGLVNSADNSFSGCENHGTILTDKEITVAYCGSFVGQCTNASKFENCVAGGRMGKYNGGNPSYYDINEENYLNYAGRHTTASTYFTKENIAYAPYQEPKGPGIKTAEDLLAFAAAVNAGESIAQWQDGDFVVNLLGDVDCSSVTAWKAIGTAAHSFDGTFDGNGYAIKGLKMELTTNASGEAFGFFGVVGAGAVIQNFVFDKDCALVLKPEQPLTAGVIAGSAADATFKDIQSAAPITLSDSKITATGTRSAIGLIGTLEAKAAPASAEGLVNSGAINVTETANTQSGATCVHVGGIVAYANGAAANKVTVKDCVNNGEIQTTVARTSGILAGPNSYCDMIGCTNNGNIITRHKTADKGRQGGICCNMANGCLMQNCINHGDITCTNSCRVGGLTSNFGAATCSVIGCENYGKIVSDSQYIGTLIGYVAQNITEFTACIARGDVGKYNGGTPAMVGVNEENYLTYCAKVKSGCETHITAANIWWSKDGVPASDTFGADKNALSFKAMSGGSQIVYISSKNEDWTVSSDQAWVKTLDAEGNAITGGSASALAKRVYVKADQNFQTTQRSATISINGGTSQASISVSQEAASLALPSKWVFNAASSAGAETWKTEGVFPATSATSGTISVERGQANASRPLNYSVSGNKPAVSMLLEGDALVWTLPAKNVEAGSRIQFDCIMGPSAATAHKYWIFEYKDGEQWKSVEEDLRIAPENASLKYTTRLFYASAYQYSSVCQCFTLENAIAEGALKVRMRAVGNYAISGAAESASSTATVFLPEFGFSGAYVQNLGKVEIKDTKKILWLGNSFSYYSNPIWMFEELALSQGHYARVNCHIKGSQTLDNHCSLELSAEEINDGSYDVAFLQDQSVNPAKLSQNGDQSVKNAAVNLAAKVRAKSPSCKIVMEATWSYASLVGDYGGSLATMENHLLQGSKIMAESVGGCVSPIGLAFSACRSQYPSYGLHHTDNKHQSAIGAYIIACVNYLTVYGGTFSADAPSCGLDATVAANVRKLCEEVVLGHEADFLIVR